MLALTAMYNEEAVAVVPRADAVLEACAATL